MSISEQEKERKFFVEEMKLEDIEAATEMRLNSWLDTYVNDDYGVSKEWVESRNAQQVTPERINSRKDRFIDGKSKGKFAAWVARDVKGLIIGSTTPFVGDDGVQHVGSIYVDKAWHGSGVGSALMQKVVDWCDSTKPIVLEVVSYNERAKAFYRKWGFKEVPNSEALFDGKIPEIKMIRKGDK